MLAYVFVAVYSYNLQESTREKFQRHTCTLADVGRQKPAYSLEIDGL